MFVFSKGKVRIFNPIMTETKEPGRKLTNNVSQREASGAKREDRRIRRYNSFVKPTKPLTNVWDIAAGGHPEHPAAFPLSLAMDHVRSWTNEGDIVLDPLAGSGTSCLAARLLGRSYIGIEISEKYCEIARNRLSQEMLF